MKDFLSILSLLGSRNWIFLDGRNPDSSGFPLVRRPRDYLRSFSPLRPLGQLRALLGDDPTSFGTKEEERGEGGGGVAGKD